MAKKYQRQLRYTLEQTQQYVDQPKEPVGGVVPEWRVSTRGNPVHVVRCMHLRMTTALFQPSDQKYHVHGLKSNPYNYACALVLEGERIRGIDYCEAKKTRFFDKNTTIVPGWHENVCYFDFDQNRVVNDHIKEGFEDFAPVDLDDFFYRTTEHWNIIIQKNRETLL